MKSAGKMKPVRAVSRAALVLRCFSADQPLLGVQELGRRTHLSRPTLYRLLATLEDSGLVESVGTPLRFRLGPGVSALAQALPDSPQALPE